VVLVLEELVQDAPDAFFVVDDQNACHANRSVVGVILLDAKR
jgi:hypothetical protein